MLISFKAVYHLLSNFLVRRSLTEYLEAIPKDYLDEFNELAHKDEYYTGLSVIYEKRDLLDDKYCLFLSKDLSNRDLVTVILKDQDVEISTFALLYLSLRHCIHVSHFHTILEAKCDHEKIDAESCCQFFDDCVSFFENEDNFSEFA